MNFGSTQPDSLVLLSILTFPFLLFLLIPFAHRDTLSIIAPNTGISNLYFEKPYLTGTNFASAPPYCWRPCSFESSIIRFICCLVIFIQDAPVSTISKSSQPTFSITSFLGTFLLWFFLRSPPQPYPPMPLSIFPTTIPCSPTTSILQGKAPFLLHLYSFSRDLLHR